MMLEAPPRANTSLAMRKATRAAAHVRNLFIRLLPRSVRHMEGESLRNLSLHHLQHLRRRHRQAVEAFAERVVHGVGDGCHHREERHFSDAFEAWRMLRVRSS